MATDVRTRTISCMCGNQSSRLPIAPRTLPCCLGHVGYVRFSWHPASYSAPYASIHQSFPRWQSGSTLPSYVERYSRVFASQMSAATSIPESPLPVQSINATLFSVCMRRLAACLMTVVRRHATVALRRSKSTTRATTSLPARMLSLWRQPSSS